jgi:hypothetical protein
MSRNLLLYKMQTLYLFLPSNTLCVCFFNKQGVFMFLVFLCCLHSFLYGVIKFRGKSGIYSSRSRSSISAEGRKQRKMQTKSSLYRRKSTK